MKNFLLLAVSTIVAMCMSAAEKTDEIPGSLTITSSYEQQVLECESGSAWILTLKNDGKGPQMKPGGGGIVTKTSIGKIKKIEVTWGSKSNENIAVYGSHEPIADPTAIEGESLGVVEFAEGATTSLEIKGDWEYIGMTATATNGKACQFVTMTVTWETSGEEPEPDPQEGIVLNEVCGNDGTADNGSEDWIELANPTSEAISLAGAKLQLVDSEGTETDLCIFGEDATIAPGEYLVCKRTVHFTAGIPHSKNIIVKLISALGKTLNKFDKRAALSDNGHHNAGGSYSRIPDMTGEWAAVQNCTPGKENDETPIEAIMKRFERISSAEELVDGMEFILVNEANDAAMSSSWATTKDGAVYQLAEKVEPLDCETPLLDADVNRVAVCKLESLEGEQWAIRFGETNNYNNEDRYMACEAFKSLKFKKTSDKAGVACTITFNEGGDAEISYGEMAGSIKFNYKGDGTDRFLNYDPADKPEDHLAVHIYKVYDETNGIGEAKATESKTATAAYNLAGQKVAPQYKGIVIINGKKILNNK